MKKTDKFVVDSIFAKLTDTIPPCNHCGHQPTEVYWIEYNESYYCDNCHIFSCLK